MTTKEHSPSGVEYPEFKSALSFSQVRDFAYPDFHPLHYGVSQETRSKKSHDYDDDNYDDDDQRLEDGPPWQEDPDLTSPVITSHEHGDRISKEYEFSVASADEIHGRAIALFDFCPENDNEAPLHEGQIIWVSYRHGQGWLVAEDPETGETGLVPEEYVQLLGPSNYDHEPIGQVCLSPEADSEGWVDEGNEESEEKAENELNETSAEIKENEENKQKEDIEIQPEHEQQADEHGKV